MIIEDVFKEFAQVVGENRMYEISLLNAHGIIVQTTMADAKGTQIADQTDTEDKVFYPLNVDGVFYGTLMVQGSNMSVIAPLIRDSLVTRVRFELQKMRIDNQMSNGELLVQMLVDPYAFDSEKVFRLCEKMNIRTDCYRVCIYLVCSSGFDSKAIANLNLLPDDDIPICSLINPKELVIFRSVAEEKMDKEMMALQRTVSSSVCPAGKYMNTMSVLKAVSGWRAGMRSRIVLSSCRNICLNILHPE